MKKLTIAGAVLIMAIVAGFLVSQVSAEAGDKAPECRVAMGITGMTCPMGCAPRVKEALQSVTGVLLATIDFDKASASVEANGGLCTQPGAKSLVDAVKNAGFGGSITGIEKIAAPKKPAQVPAPGTKSS